MCDRINYCQQYLHSDSMGQWAHCRDRQGEKHCHRMTTATLEDLKRKLCLFSDLHWNPNYQNAAGTMTLPTASVICLIQIKQRQGIQLYQGSNTRFLFSHIDRTSQRTSFRTISLGKTILFKKSFNVAIKHQLFFNPLIYPTGSCIRDADRDWCHTGKTQISRHYHNEQNLS